MKLVFMGTPAFAVPSLKRLLKSQHQVSAVFCQPDRAKGRSLRAVPCPVKEEALSHQIPVFQPDRVRKKPWPETLSEMKPDAIVVAAYGHILSKKILNIPTFGCINVHASLLPRWRGASPIHHAILAGDTETGVSIMRMVKELDAGPVFGQQKCPIDPDETRLELEARLSQMGADLLLSTLESLSDLKPEPQDETRVTFAPMITKNMGHCNFSQSAFDIVNMIRAFADWPTVRCLFRKKVIRLIRAGAVSLPHATPIGQIIERSKKCLVIGAGGNTGLDLQEVQIAGKKVMNIQAFINGFQPRIGEEFCPL